MPEQSISITLPDGSVKQGIAFKTCPMDIAASISQGLADSIIIAKVVYSTRYEENTVTACDNDDEKEAAAMQAEGDGELWDLNRPLVGDCSMRLLKYEDPESKTVR
jgi:threonyl-tRNA synthetase